MYQNEITFYLREQKHRAFLQIGFYVPRAYSKNLHKHNHTEIHIVTEGCSHFRVDGKERTVKGGTLVVFPKGSVHRCSSVEPTALHVSFQTDCEAETFQTHPIRAELIRDFFREISEARESGDHTRVASYISLFCGYYSHDSFPARPIADHGFLIREFFSIHYGEDVHLTDLAAELCTSERHAERLVIKHTGHSFREELTATRMSMARQLMDDTEMPLTEIAQYVGYRSYSGFWKALKKHGFPE